MHISHTESGIEEDVEEIEVACVFGGKVCDDIGNEDIHAMNEHLAKDLLGYIEQPDACAQFTAAQPPG